MKKVYIQCSCYTEGMLVEFDEDDGLYYVSYLGHSRESFVLSWKNRIRFIYRLITKGRIYTDQLILDKDGWKELITFLGETGVHGESTETHTTSDGSTISINENE